jgi:hypothetical protein
VIPYKNSSKKSGVVAYEAGKTFIRIKFKDAPFIYTYNYIKPGKTHVLQMRKLADEGNGLSTYISQNVRDNYFSRE